MRCLAFLIFLTVCLSAVQSQNHYLRDSLARVYDDRQERVLRYLSQRGGSQMYESGGSIYLIKDVDSFGLPVIIKTDNSGAAITTGVTSLYLNGGLGLNLTGNGVLLGVWDGGRVRDSHVELMDRVFPSDGAGTNNFHATHVAGTILASGVNSSAKGMAPNAQAKTFDFSNDEVEMANNMTDGESGVLISNHSYGTVSGWNEGAWFGNPSVSTQEDYKFGFYDFDARLWDQLVYEAPFYTIVKSAGNDRGQSGNGLYPPDGPYDIISTYGTAKNIITIGAVNKVSTYSNPSSVVMSSFSGWGPTDDGRIKPDFVAAGVSLYSTLEKSDEDYGFLSGTSMSAPNASGSFALLQELYRNLSGSFMEAAQLKALIAHTALECGLFDGPDYRFGWGLINAKDAAELLLSSNGVNKIFIPIDLENGETFSLDFLPKSDTKVTATLCWTDVPGTPVAVQLDPTDLMLVNDLDMRILNSDTRLPWMLDPLDPESPAVPGDNFRDNIEKIEFVSDGQNSTLVISHKGTLTNEVQRAFLILTYESELPSNVFHWRGSQELNWSDLSNWSFSSGGTIAGSLPSERDVVIFDNNSLFEANSTIVLTENISVGSLVSIQDNGQISIDLNGYVLEIRDRVSLGGSISFMGEGLVRFANHQGNSPVAINIGSSLKDVDVEFDDSLGEWIFTGENILGEVVFKAGSLILDNTTLEVISLLTSGTESKSLSSRNGVFKVLDQLSFLSPLEKFDDEGCIYEFSEPNSSLSTNFEHQGTLKIINGSVQVDGSGSFKMCELMNGVINLGELVQIDKIALLSGSHLRLSEDVAYTFDDFIVDTSEDNPVRITSNGISSIALNGHRKICLENLSIDNVNFTGTSLVSVGIDSELINSSGWLDIDCDEVLFPNFSVQYACAGSLVQFNNLSTGNFSSVLWNFDNLGTSNSTNPTFLFDEAGVYEVTLEISNQVTSSSYTFDVTISEGLELQGTIFENSTSLVSLLAGNTYQWFYNGAPIEGAVSRTYVHNDQLGVYQVVVFFNECNVVSSPYEILVAGIDSGLKSVIYPNPSNGTLGVQLMKSCNEIKIYSLSGDLVKVFNINESRDVSLDIGTLPKGMYFVNVVYGDSEDTHKLLLR